MGVIFRVCLKSNMKVLFIFGLICASVLANPLPQRGFQVLDYNNGDDYGYGCYDEPTEPPQQPQYDDECEDEPAPYKEPEPIINVDIDDCGGGCDGGCDGGCGGGCDQGCDCGCDTVNSGCDGGC